MWYLRFNCEEGLEATFEEGMGSMGLVVDLGHSGFGPQEGLPSGTNHSSLSTQRRERRTAVLVCTKFI